jgi:hypothetical protein
MAPSAAATRSAAVGQGSATVRVLSVGGQPGAQSLALVAGWPRDGGTPRCACSDNGHDARRRSSHSRSTRADRWHQAWRRRSSGRARTRLIELAVVMMCG